MTKDKDRKRVEDEAGVGPDPRQARHLTPLKELPRFKISGHDPDIRGWSVFTSNGREVGRVDDLLVDTTIGEAVMLDVDLVDSDRHTLAPMRAAWIDREHDRVILDSAELASSDELPTLGRTAPSNPELERLGERYPRPADDLSTGTDREQRVAGEPAAPRLTGRTVADASLPAGSEVIVERRLVSPDEPSRAAASDAIEGPRELRASGDAASAGADRRLVEEVVVRRRYVDAAELEAARRDVPPDETSGTRS